MTDDARQEAVSHQDTEQQVPSQISQGLGPEDASTLEAEKAAYIQPPAPRRLAGRFILSLQQLYDRLLAGRLVQVQNQVIQQDRELSDLAHDVAELSTQVGQMNRRLKELDRRLVDLEGTSDPPTDT